MGFAAAASLKRPGEGEWALFFSSPYHPSTGTAWEGSKERGAKGRTRGPGRTHPLSCSSALGSPGRADSVYLLLSERGEIFLIIFQLLKSEALHSLHSRKKERKGREKEPTRERWASQVNGTSPVDYRPQNAPRDLHQGSGGPQWAGPGSGLSRALAWAQPKRPPLPSPPQLTGACPVTCSCSLPFLGLQPARRLDELAP